MTTISLRLPDSLHNQARELARLEGVSLHQLIGSAVAEKLASLMTSEYLDERATRATRAAFETALAKAADIEAPEKDRF